MPRRPPPKADVTPTPESAAEWVNPASLVPWKGNPRVNAHAVDQVAKSIERFGFGAPLLVRREGRTIIAGHTRLKAAIKLGLARVPARFLDIDEAAAKALALADNKLGELATWNYDGLAGLIEEDGLDLTDLGWSDAEVDALINEVEPAKWGWGDSADIKKGGRAPRTVSVTLYLPTDATIERAIERALAGTPGITRSEAIVRIFQEYLGEGAI